MSPNTYLPSNSSIKDSRSKDRVVSKIPSCRRCSIAHISDPQLNAGNTDINHRTLACLTFNCQIFIVIKVGISISASDK